MSSCNHDCASCSDKCEKESLLKKPHHLSKIKKVVAVLSGKGGVGKSLITSLLAVGMQNRNKKVGILDADITGPSIPKVFGTQGKIIGAKEGLIPHKTKSGLQLVSSNLLLKNETDPVLWRGPIIANLVQQFWTDVIWDDLDYLFIDMPPGTGDVSLTVFQSISVDAIIIVTSPQELVSMIVQKAVKMANMMNIPILGIVENMSYLECDNCHHQIKLFGESDIDNTAKLYNLNVLARLPLNPQFASLCDKGHIEEANVDHLDNVLALLEEMPLKYTNILVPFSANLNKAKDFLLVKSLKQMIIHQEQVNLPDDEELIDLAHRLDIFVILANSVTALLADKLRADGFILMEGLDEEASDLAKKYVRQELVEKK